MAFTVKVNFTLIIVQTSRERLFCQDMSNCPVLLRNKGEEKESFSNKTPVIVFAIFVQLWQYTVRLCNVSFPGCVGGKWADVHSSPSHLPHVTVSGHRVKMEDPQKMQFSDRLSEIERYQRSMRIGPVNNNPRPIHQTHLSTTQGENHNCTDVNKHHHNTIKVTPN